MGEPGEVGSLSRAGVENRPQASSQMDPVGRTSWACVGSLSESGRSVPGSVLKKGRKGSCYPSSLSCGALWSRLCLGHEAWILLSSPRMAWSGASSPIPGAFRAGVMVDCDL